MPEGHGARRFSFPKEERILRQEDFARVRKLGKRVNTRSFTLFFLPNGLDRRRLGLSVSARVGGAVVRNRLKRLLREFFRLNKAAFPPSADILISVKSPTFIKGLRDVEEELGPALSRAGGRGSL